MIVRVERGGVGGPQGWVDVNMEVWEARLSIMSVSPRHGRKLGCVDMN